MQERTVTIPELILIAGTRVALGVGIGLLLADKFTDKGAKGRWVGAAGRGRVEYDPDCFECPRQTGCRNGLDSNRPTTKRAWLLSNKRRCYIERTRILESLHE
jgi:hypothetical protein